MQLIFEFKMVDIIVPIYNAPLELDGCLTALLKYTPEANQIFLIDDASENSEIPNRLRSAQSEDSRVVVVKHGENRGFLQTANHGFSLSNNDVVLLNSDTRVTSGWLGKLLQCKARHPKTHLISPLSNYADPVALKVLNAKNSPLAEKCPETIAALIHNLSDRQYPPIPTANGFCCLVTRDALRCIGGFDPLFSRGYCEEVDFSQKAIHLGFEIRCCDDTYVFHKGSASFGNSEEIQRLRKNNEETIHLRWPQYLHRVKAFFHKNPLRPLEERLITDYFATDPRPSVLHVRHPRLAHAALGENQRHTIILPQACVDPIIDLESEWLTKSVRIVRMYLDVWNHQRLDNEIRERVGEFSSMGNYHDVRWAC